MKYYIYKITDSKNQEEFYIGSTKDISRRKSQHKKNTCNKSKKSYWRKVYQYIRANGGWTSFEVTILEAGNCEDSAYMKQKEQEYINKLKPTLNSSKAVKCCKEKLIYNVTELNTVPTEENI